MKTNRQVVLPLGTRISLDNDLTRLSESELRQYALQCENLIVSMRQRLAAINSRLQAFDDASDSIHDELKHAANSRRPDSHHSRSAAAF